MKDKKKALETVKEACKNVEKRNAVETVYSHDVNEDIIVFIVRPFRELKIRYFWDNEFVNYILDNLNHDGAVMAIEKEIEVTIEKKWLDIIKL